MFLEWVNHSTCSVSLLLVRGLGFIFDRKKAGPCYLALCNALVLWSLTEKWPKPALWCCFVVGQCFGSLVFDRFSRKNGQSDFLMNEFLLVCAVWWLGHFNVLDRVLEMQSKMNAVRISDLFLCCNVWCFCVLDRKNEMQIAGSVFQDVWTMLLLLDGCLFWSCRVLDSFLENGQNVVLSMSEFLLVWCV